MTDTDQVSSGASASEGLSEDERHFIRHALGLTRQMVGYRNFYSAGGDDTLIGRALVAKGMAVECRPNDVFPNPTFVITTAGFEAAKEHDETMDKEERQKMNVRDQRLGLQPSE